LEPREVMDGLKRGPIGSSCSRWFIERIALPSLSVRMRVDLSTCGSTYRI
jgi:hypothetical protein